MEAPGPGPHRELQTQERGQVVGSLKKKEEEVKAENVQVNRANNSYEYKTNRGDDVTLP